MNTPLLSLRGIRRDYRNGDTTLTVLRDVHLDIQRGEFIAIVGQSGSGKSTLMNVLGCLDRPTGGEYFINGRSVAECSDDELAQLRRETFGFVFQRYHLVPSLTALENTEVPAIYTGSSAQEREQRAIRTLEAVGLGDRLYHRPGELSGGQQQRVSIARALMNGAEVILADEPTGALDSASGESVMALLKELHAQGRTIVVVTHDPEIAAHAQRLVRIKDGSVVEDRLLRTAGAVAQWRQRAPQTFRASALLQESFRMAWRSLTGNRLRTFLTLLGVIIGVASVVAMLGVGAGMQDAFNKQFEALGIGNLTVQAGAGLGGVSRAEVRSLVDGDVVALRRLPGVAGVTPESTTQVVVRTGNKDARVTAVGAAASIPQIQNWQLAEGRFFEESHERRYSQVAVLGALTAGKLFPGGGAVGQYVIVDNAPYLILGVMKSKGSGMGGYFDDRIFVPASTFNARIVGHNWYPAVHVQAASGFTLQAVGASVQSLLLERHGKQDFMLINPEQMIEQQNRALRMMTVFLGAIGAISLLVSGIGVMNIMLVSVTERVSEIGIRRARGGRARDVMGQFLTEAVVVCCIGGAVGVLLVAAGAQLLKWNLAGDIQFRLLIEPGPVVLAFGCAFATGVIFGFLPARKAAALAPVQALARE